MSARTLLASWGLAVGSALLIAPPALGANCTISTTVVSFGTYNVFAPAPLDSTGSVTYNCSGNASITISLGPGGAGTFTPRGMRKGIETLPYNLYRDATRTTIWGNGTGGTQVYSAANVPNNQNVTVTIYSRIPAQQDVSAGSYSDAITATINF